MRSLFLTLPVVAFLSACIEVDMTIDVLGEDEARVTGFMQMPRQMFEMSGQDDSFCSPEDGGTFELTETHARCTFDQTGSFDEIMNSSAAPDAADAMDGTLVYLGEGRVRAVLPLSAMNSDMEEMGDDPAMLAMMRQMFSGLSISLTLQGKEIESSTGTISEDGRAASISLGVDDLIGPEEPLADFETVLRF